MPFEGKRKTLVRFNAPGHAHFLTFSCNNELPLLAADRWQRFLSQTIVSACEKQRVCLVAFVYMPEHVHLLVYPLAHAYDISRFLFAVKRPFSYRVRRALEEARDPLVRSLTVRERPSRLGFRFWQEGAGHDRNILSTDNALKTIEYIHNNPVRRGLCASPDEWKWSSWKWYHRREEYDLTCLPRMSELPA